MSNFIQFYIQNCLSPLREGETEQRTLFVSHLRAFSPYQGSAPEEGPATFDLPFGLRVLDCGHPSDLACSVGLWDPSWCALTIQNSGVG